MSFYLEKVLKDETTLYGLLAITLLTIWYYVKQIRNHPPGPYGLPLFGFYPFLEFRNFHLHLYRLTKKYGELYSFTLFGNLFVNLGSGKAVKEVFLTKSDCFAQRPEKFGVLHNLFEGGISYIKGDHWRAIRKFLMQQLKERGMTNLKENSSAIIYDTIKEVVTNLSDAKTEPIDINEILLNKSGKLMQKTFFGGDGLTDEDMDILTHLYFEIDDLTINKHLILSGTFSKYFIYPFTKNYHKSVEVEQKMQDILQKAIDRRKSSFDETNIRDCIDAYFKEKKDREFKKDPTAKYFSERVLRKTLVQTVGDGVTFVTFFIAYFVQVLLEHPEEQEKIYKEIVDVIGIARDPVMEDKKKMVYTNAFILEVMRTNLTLSIPPMLECTKDTVICGHKIPKGTIAVNNFWAVHMNPDDYEEPEKFNPSRFIVKSGEKRPDLPISFGVGRRACLGEGFTMIQFFLYVTNVVKNFRLTKPKDVKGVEGQLYVCAYPRH